MNTARTHIDREPRLPLVVRVLTRPPLLECWSVNISRSGLGLMALGNSGQTEPAEGDSMEAEFRLPETGATVRLRGVVAWRHEAPSGLPGRATVSVGLTLEHMEDRARVALSRYLETYRFHVAAAFCADGEREAVAAALDPEVSLHFADSLAGLDTLLVRGDISVVLLCGADPAPALAWAEARRGDPTPSDLARPGDLAPRIICAAALPTTLVAHYFNSRTLFRMVPQPLDAEELRRSVLAGCHNFGMQTEQHRLGLALERALLRDRALERTPARLKRLVSNRMLNVSAEMARVMELVRIVTPHRTSVLLQGETGTGKEVIAHLIHELSDRANAAFVVQDCGTLSETLLESELFGHVKGSFTGAVANHDGLFVTADGGSILLDEVENTTPSVQAKLLRVIETGEVRPVGGTSTRLVDVRVIAASNRDLEAEVAAGRFRPDLYFRLSTFPIQLPPLRERRADILPLARRFLIEACTSAGCAPKNLDAEAEALLEQHPWPGNVRELRNAMERAVLLTPRQSQAVQADALPEAVTRARLAHAARRAQRGPRPAGATLKTLVGQFEAELIRETLASHGGSVKTTAAALGIDEVTLWRKAKRHGLK